jgi:hypothetical protein
LDSLNVVYPGNITYMMSDGIQATPLSTVIETNSRQT